MVHDDLDCRPLATGLAHEAVERFKTEIRKQNAVVMEGERRPEQSGVSHCVIVATDAAKPRVYVYAAPIVPVWQLRNEASEISHARLGPNENKISDAYRRRALIGGGMA